MSANFDVTGCSFRAETGVVGAEGILSYKSFGSLIAGLTIGYFAGCRLDEDIFSDEVSAPRELDLLTVEDRPLEDTAVSESLTMAITDN